MEDLVRESCLSTLELREDASEGDRQGAMALGHRKPFHAALQVLRSHGRQGERAEETLTPGEMPEHSLDEAALPRST